MAEIPIERKPKSNIWPMLLGLLALLAIIWFLAARCHNNNAPVGAADSTAAANSAATANGAVPTDTSAMAGAATGAATGAAATGAAAAGAVGAMGADTGLNAAGTSGNAAAGGGATGAIAEFTRFVSAVSPNATEEMQHAYTAGGIRRLADALSALGATGAPIQNMRSQASALQNSSPTSTKHADMARSAFASAADAFASLKGPSATGASTALGNVHTAANAVRPGAHLLDQKDRIQAFFVSAKNALQAMTPGR